MSIDSVVTDANSGSSFNRYAYANNSPFKFVDPDGRNPLLIAMGAGALIGGAVNAATQYISTGSVTWGGIGGVLDAASDGAMFGMMGSVVSAGAGARISATSSSTAVQAPVKTNFIVTNNGVATHTTTKEIRDSLNGAGMAGKPVQNTSGTETGTIHNAPAMKMDIRVMDGGPVHPARAVTSRQGTSQPVNPANGRNFGNVPKAEQRAASHIVLP